MKIKIQDIKNDLGIKETYDIVNAIRNSSSEQFANYVPLASLDNVAEVGAGILINQTIQNEFITALVDRIGLVVVKRASLRNPLAKFKKGAMPMGRTVEEIFTDITKAKQYNPKDSEQTVFKRTIPNVKVLFHERNRQDFYEQTIQDESLQSAFTTWANFESFISSIINAIYNSAEVDEYEYMKLLVDNYYSKGLFKVEKVESVSTPQGASNFVKKLRATARKMTLPNGSRDFNSLAVRTRTEMEDLHLLISADLEAEIDVEVLAKAFNMNKTDFIGKITVVDGFETEGLQAVLIDSDWFMVYDNLLKLETIRNPKGLYWNYFYHVWQTLSVSRFANAVAFTTAPTPKVTQVIVSPTIAEVTQGESFQFEGIIRNTAPITEEIVWSVVGAGTTTVDTGTTIDAEGLLKVSLKQTGELIVKATVTVAEETAVVGEAIVTVTPKV